MQERRRHRVFVTRNTEYHLHRDVCVGVRDRKTGRWDRRHAALRMLSVRVPEPGDDDTWVGRRLQLVGGGSDVVTSPLVEVGRPPQNSVEQYIFRQSAGVIEAEG